MSQDRWQQIEDLFHRAVELAPESRAAFLDEACAADEALRVEVESLLIHDSTDDTTFEGPPPDEIPTFIAHYRIIEKIGEGGMGAVYRATDTRLNREVAIKLLPPTLAKDAVRMARFEREAQILASLNHPNIASIYGIEQGAIVMELVEGDELQGPVPLETAIQYARQIAAALESAHEKNVIHRDLKPANIKVSEEGKIKVLDFGLAKVFEPEVSSGKPSATPVPAMHSTHTGVILGTAGYMSPEQARGKPVDRRADIWAFGVIFYELLTGSHAFEGESVSEKLAAVLRDEIDWSRLPAETPPSVRRLLQRCLQRDPKLRLRDIGDAWIEVDAPLDMQSRGRMGGTTTAPATGADAPLGMDKRMPGFGVQSVRKSKRPWFAWIAFALALGAVSGAAIFAWLVPRSVTRPIVRFSILWPEGTRESTLRAATQAVPSPDGRLVAFVAAAPDGNNSLWIRSIDSPTPRRLDKTDGANFPFWSPDGQLIAFFADEKLKKIPANGGSPQILCDAIPPGASQNTGDGGTWNGAGVIVFALGPGSPLMRVSENGGPATPATTLDVSAGETKHVWPQFLTDGRHLLYFSLNRDSSKSAIYIGELGSSKRVLVTRSLLRAAWAPSGHLLFQREGALFAQRMDPKTFQLTGEPVQIAEEVTGNEANGRAAFAVSAGGLLVYRAGPLAGTGQLVWYTRDGKRIGVVGQPGQYQAVRLSPNDKSAALVVGSNGRFDTWIMDLVSGSLTRATNEGQTSTDVGPWSPNSERIAINNSQKETILELTVASGKTRMVSTSEMTAHDWSPDGRSLLCTDRSGNDLAVLPLEGDLVLRTISHPPATKTQLRISPDGKFVAYTSWESERSQIFVASFPAFSERRQISISGGLSPTWRKDGKELFFRTFDGMVMSAELETGAEIKSGIPKPLFKYTTDPYGVTYTPTGDGTRFLTIENGQKNEGGQFMVVVNWMSQVKK